LVAGANPARATINRKMKKLKINFPINLNKKDFEKFLNSCDTNRTMAELRRYNKYKNKTRNSNFGEY
jgi:alpha-beta hydrolase superfamily lysophospholipase